MFSRQGQTHLQADNNARSASCALNVIKVLSAQPRANSPKILLVWYGAWCARGHAAHHRLGPSPSHQQDGRHAGSWATRSAPHILVYIEAGVLPLWQYIQLSAAKYKFRCQTVANSSLKEIHIRVLQEPCPSPVLLFQLWFGPRPGSRSGGEWGPGGGKAHSPLPSLVDGEAERSSGHGESEKGGEPAWGAVPS